MSKLMKKPFAGKPGNKPNNGPGNKKNKKNFANKNGVHKPNAQNIKKAVQQKNQKPNQKNQPQKGKHTKKNVSLEESDDEGVNDGVPMFKGLPVDSPTKPGKKNNQKNKKAPKVEESIDSSLAAEEEDDDSSLDSDDLEDAEIDDSDSEDVYKSLNSSVDSSKDKSLQLKDLLGASLADDDDDEEFEGKSEEEEDDDDVSDEDVDDEEMSADDDDDDDEDEEDDSEDEEEELPHKKSKTLKMEDLLGKSIEDDEDDEEFEIDDDDSEEETDISKSDISKSDISMESPKKKSKKEKPAKAEKPQLSEEEIRQRDERTIYVCNVPKDCTPDKLEKVFKRFGKIESVRIRGVIPENQKIGNQKLAKKVAYITKKMHPKVNNLSAFVVFASKESAEKAVSMNGKKIDDNILNVNLLIKKNEFESKKAVFLGNLPFDVNFNELHSLFSKCGAIDSLRLIRDKRTGMGKGFGYVNFSTVDAVTLALELNGTKVGQREIRVKICSADHPSKRKRMASGNEGPNKKFKKFNNDKPSQNKNQASNGKAQVQGEKKKKPFVKKEQVKTEISSPKQEAKPFAGQKADGKKKKNKPNKGMQEKKAMAKKLMTNKGGKAK